MSIYSETKHQTANDWAHDLMLAVDCFCMGAKQGSQRTPLVRTAYGRHKSFVVLPIYVQTTIEIAYHGAQKAVGWKSSDI